MGKHRVSTMRKSMRRLRERCLGLGTNRGMASEQADRIKSLKLEETRLSIAWRTGPRDPSPQVTSPPRDGGKDIGASHMVVAALSMKRMVKAVQAQEYSDWSPARGHHQGPTSFG